MKNLIIAIALIVISISVSAQVEVYGRYTLGGTVEPNINIFGTKKISDKLNLTYFALVEETWSETLVGFAYAPTKWLEIGLSAGVEHNPAILNLSRNLSETVSIGAMAWRFHGLGPIVKYTPKKSDLTFWLLPAYDLESKAKRLMVGVAIKI